MNRSVTVGDLDDEEKDIPQIAQLREPLSRRLYASNVDLSRLVLFMALLGIVAALFIFLVDMCVALIFELRRHISVDLTSGPLGYIIYVASGVLLCLLSTYVCQRWSKEAEGSGLPQMKAIMSGFYDKLKTSLDKGALMAKAVGLVCAIGGGLPVGWEGPNVHMSCIIADFLSKMSYFRSIRHDRALRLQIMACACTVGLASSFGTPVGAVLYALESTSTFYLVPTFWKSVLATIAGAMVFDILYKTPVAEAFENTTFGIDDYTRGQLILFCVLGVFMGCCGAFFVKCAHEVYSFRKRRLTYLSNRFVLVGTVALVSGLLQYNNELLRLDPRKAINELFSSNAMQLMTYTDVITLLLIKFPLIAVSIGLPIPGGVFIPSFLLGAGMGRLYGELMKHLLGPSIVPGLYAVVGAASFTAGVTRALSCSVLIFEVTGQISHMMPILVAVLLAVIVANSINRSLYDTLILMKNLPYMPNVRQDVFSSQRVTEVMETDLVVVKEKTTTLQLDSVLRESKQLASLPIVSENGSLIGAIRVTQLQALLDNIQVRFKRLENRKDGKPQTAGKGEEPRSRLNKLPPENGTRNEYASDQKEDREAVDLQIIPEISPLIVGDNMTVSQVHYMFVSLMPTHAFVISRGKLAGVIRRKDIIQM